MLKFINFHQEQANSLYLSTMTGVDYQIMQDSPLIQPILVDPILLVCPNSTYSRFIIY